MIEPQPIKSTTQLFVEGNDQRNFFEAFRDHLSLDHIQIQNFGGVGDLPGFLQAFVGTDQFEDMDEFEDVVELKDIVESIGIVRDAEESAQSAFQSVQSSLRNAGLPVPSCPRERTDDAPAVTVLILPNDNSPGMLETLLCQTFAASPLNDCIDSYFECVQTLPDINMRRPHKARAHAYIATQPQPHLSVGVAAKNGYWNFNHSAFTAVRRFLETL